jgi:Fe(3+) dicitrate transport protein
MPVHLSAFPLLLLTLALMPVLSLAQQPDPKPLILEGISVVGDKAEDLYTATGSAHRVDEATLEKDEYDNINRVLNDVPGIYIRGEDGYGLRPNIGIRGTTTERSQKITLMMDGVVMAPAVYSAPSAYFFPQVSRMVGVEVVKGPAAITHGPATVGGAVNLITRPVPGNASGGLDAALGSNHYGKLHGYYGDSNDLGGYLIEAIQTRTDGFKELDSGGDTGFRKNDVMLKGRINSDATADQYQQLDFSITYANEVSDETYLGLTDADVNNNPNRRYAASQLDRMDWDYLQTHIRHRFEFNEQINLVTDAYYQSFERDWFKLNRFNSTRTIGEVLANPEAGLNADFMAVLRGEKDSDTAQETLMLGNNGREFFSRGVQSQLDWTIQSGTVTHDVSIGLRLHQDQIERNHTEGGYLMRNGDLQADGNGISMILDQRERADAFAVFIKDEMQFGRLKVVPGVRFEHVDYESINTTSGAKIKNDNQEWLPALGLHYQLTDTLGLLAGVHRGFVPTGPGAGSNIEPEKSVSYEAGIRFNNRDTQAEVIAFFNDYSNLKGVCTFSSGCVAATGEAFNGGEVDIFGIEALIRHQYLLNDGWRIPLGLTYTFTQSEFKSDFESTFPMWGEVKSGDELPYMPRHRLSASIGLGHDDWEANLRTSHLSEQQEQAGSGGPLEDSIIDSYTVVDASAQYYLPNDQQVYLRIENLLDESYMVSRRPFGARPGIERTLLLGYKVAF